MSSYTCQRLGSTHILLLQVTIDPSVIETIVATPNFSLYCQKKLTLLLHCSLVAQREFRGRQLFELAQLFQLVSLEFDYMVDLTGSRPHKSLAENPKGLS